MLYIAFRAALRLSRDRWRGLHLFPWVSGFPLQESRKFLVSLSFQVKTGIRCEAGFSEVREGFPHEPGVLDARSVLEPGIEVQAVRPVLQKSDISRAFRCESSRKKPGQGDTHTIEQGPLKARSRSSGSLLPRVEEQEGAFPGGFVEILLEGLRIRIGSGPEYADDA